MYLTKCCVKTWLTQYLFLLNKLSHKYLVFLLCFQNNNDHIIQWSDDETTTADYWYGGPGDYPTTQTDRTVIILELQPQPGEHGIWNYTPTWNDDHIFPLCQFAQ